MSDETLDLPEFMDRVQDDKDLLLELLNIYEEDYVGKRKQLGEAIAKKNIDEMRNLAHSLKGASGNISAKKLRLIFLKLEDMGHTESMEGADALLKDVDAEYEKLRGRMKEVRSQLGA